MDKTLSLKNRSSLKAFFNEHLKIFICSCDESTSSVIDIISVRLILDPEEIEAACLEYRNISISSRRSFRCLPAQIPMRFSVAPVRLLLKPKSSLSRRFMGSRLHCTGTNGISLLPLIEWIYLAITSLPVPLSPVISTVRRWCDLSAIETTSSILGLATFIDFLIFRIFISVRSFCFQQLSLYVPGPFITEEYFVPLKALL